MTARSQGVKSKGKKINGKAVIGLVEPVQITGQTKTVKTTALIDTGSTRTTVDMEIAAKAGLGPITEVVNVKKSDAQKRIKRVAVKGLLTIKGKQRVVEMTVSDRGKSKYPVLLGREVLHKDFVIDLQKTHHSHRIKDLKKKKRR